MMWLGFAVIAAHTVLLSVLCCFGLHRLSMVLRWFWFCRTKTRQANPKPKVFADLPRVTVQVPLYNERMVAERVIDAVAALSYPAGRLQIQIVDDSTDETRDLVSARVAMHQKAGVNIEHVRRSDRQGYKAGGLKHAMHTASGEFIAIFDADFIPHPSILEDNIHHFTAAEVGMVQFRWEHLNRDRSSLTKTQAMMLDAHFVLEQNVRNASQLFLNFNGTAGIWRTQTILDAGHWSADTLTEDLDLSYRAQLRGWRMVYLNDQICAGEIPANMDAFKSQQHRWVKGGVQVMIKMLKTVWSSPIGINKKLEATFHLSNNLAYFIMLIDTVFLLIPSLVFGEYLGFERRSYWFDIPIVFMASGGHLIYLIFGQFALAKSRREAVLYAPRLLLLGIQLAVNNAKAALEGLTGQQSEFVRTPKSGDCQGLNLGLNLGENSVKPRSSLRLYRAVAPTGTVFELLFAAIFLVAFVWALTHQVWIMLPFLSLLVIGFANNALNIVFRSRA